MKQIIANSTHLLTTKTENIAEKYKRTFTLAATINNNPAVGGNTVILTKNSPDALKSMIHDIDAAKISLHISFYIWLDDADGLKILEAVKKAAQRGVECRIMVDGMGSKKLISRKEWKHLADTNIEAHVIFPLKNIFKTLINSRVDIRNHRKICIIDNKITYCGSQNCCGEDFYVKPKYAPWVDIMLRVQGGLVLQNQKLFIIDWYIVTGQDISSFLTETDISQDGKTLGVAVGTGPSEKYNAASHLLESTFQSAQKSLYLVTPYYVPNQAIQSTLCSLAEGGVHVRIIFPENNDSFIVGAASRSYYRELLEAGVEIFEYKKGLLHSKIAVIDDELSLLGSTNLDRRSFDLNYENSMLLLDTQLAKEINERQEFYLKDARQIMLDEVLLWPKWKNIKRNIMAIIGPLL